MYGSKRLRKNEGRFMNISDEDFAKFCSYVQEGMESLAQAIENGRHPQYARPTAVYIGIPEEKNNFCRLTYSCFNSDKKDILTLSVGVIRKGEDALFESFYFNGTEKEFIDYVRKPSYDCKALTEHLIKLSDKCNKYYENRD